MTTLVPSPNAPRPPEDSLARELADMLAAVERNYGREGSGPGTRFEGQLLEDAQARAVLRRVAELAEKVGATWLEPCDKDDQERGRLHTHHRRPFADLLRGAGAQGGREAAG